MGGHTSCISGHNGLRLHGYHGRHARGGKDLDVGSVRLVFFEGGGGGHDNDDTYAYSPCVCAVAFLCTLEDIFSATPQECWPGNVGLVTTRPGKEGRGGPVHFTPLHNRIPPPLSFRPIPRSCCLDFALSGPPRRIPASSMTRTSSGKITCG